MPEIKVQTLPILISLRGFQTLLDGPINTLFFCVLRPLALIRFTPPCQFNQFTWSFSKRSTSETTQNKTKYFKTERGCILEIHPLFNNFQFETRCWYRKTLGNYFDNQIIGMLTFP